MVLPFFLVGGGKGFFFFFFFQFAFGVESGLSTFYASFFSIKKKKLGWESKQRVPKFLTCSQ